jgi:hypothetical protein
MLQTDQQFSSVSSQTKRLLVNADGPKAPAGKKINWVQTVPGKGWNTILRLYGPLEPSFDGGLERSNSSRDRAIKRALAGTTAYGT